MSYLLPHLHSGYAVDQAIVSEEDRVVCIRFGHDHDPDCMLQVGVGIIPAHVRPLARDSPPDIPSWSPRSARGGGTCTPRSPPLPGPRGRGGVGAGAPRGPPCTPPPTPLQDETLSKISDKVKNFAVIYLVDVTEVPDFNTMYELYDACTMMFFFRNKHMMIDLGTGNNNKINWALTDGQELIDIIETVYKGARKGRGLVVSPKDYSTKYRY